MSEIPSLSLSRPVGGLLRPIVALFPEDSLAVAARTLRENSTSLAAITVEGRLVGLLTEAVVAKAIADGLDVKAPISEFMAPPVKIAPYATGAEALRVFESNGFQPLVVADDRDLVRGILQPSDLLFERKLPVKPNAIGGMATPFGVYLTTGAVKGGAGHFALIATGVAMGARLVVAVVVANLVAIYASQHHAADWFVACLDSFVTLLIFAIMMRLAQLAGYHAAEHMTIHAIERGEPLDVDVVRRMPRVHPRCGTNLAVGAMLFLTVMTTGDTSKYLELRFFAAAILTWFLWKPLGSLVQKWVTTKKPNEKELQAGVKAGREILENYQCAAVTQANFFKRLVYSGMFHVMLGAFLCVGAAELIGYLAGRPDLVP